jgi:hypothetical protein
LLAHHILQFQYLDVAVRHSRLQAGHGLAAAAQQLASPVFFALEACQGPAYGRSNGRPLGGGRQLGAEGIEASLRGNELLAARR